MSMSIGQVLPYGQTKKTPTPAPAPAPTPAPAPAPEPSPTPTPTSEPAPTAPPPSPSPTPPPTPTPTAGAASTSPTASVLATNYLQAPASPAVSSTFITDRVRSIAPEPEAGNTASAAPVDSAAPEAATNQVPTYQQLVAQFSYSMLAEASGSDRQAINLLLPG